MSWKIWRSTAIPWVSLNLYNCFELSIEALGRVLIQCPHLKHIYLALSARNSGRHLLCDYLSSIQHPETLNVYGLGIFFHRYPVLPALKSLAMNALTSTCYEPHLVPSLQRLKLIDIYYPKEVSCVVSHHRAMLRTLQLKRSTLTPHDLPIMLNPAPHDSRAARLSMVLSAWGTTNCLPVPITHLLKTLHLSRHSSQNQSYRLS